MTLTSFQEELCSTSRWDFSDLKALYVNCTLKPSPEPSNTAGLMRHLDRDHGAERGRGRLRPRGRPRPGARRLAGHARARLPRGRLARLYERVKAARHPRSRLADLARREVVRVHACRSSGSTPARSVLNEDGPVRVLREGRRCLITGNEDGIKHCSMNILYSLQHLGYTIPPQADAGWIGEAGPGPSYLDEGSGGPGQRLHQPEHHLHDVEPPPSRPVAEGRRRRARPTATSGRSGTRGAASTSRTRSTASWPRRAASRRRSAPPSSSSPGARSGSRPSR